MKYPFLTFVNLLITATAFSQSWSLNGNSGSSNSHFIGTTDNNPLIIKVNNQWAGFSGYGGNYNVSFGFRANPKNTGWDNTVLGSQTLTNNTTGIRNVAIGSYALDPNTTGQDNVAVGESASALQSGGVSFIVALGRAALMNNQKSGNTAVGFEAGAGNTTGDAFTAVGFKALCNNKTGGNNSAFGFNALINNSTGSWNTALGAWTLVANTTGEHNTTIGWKSLYSNTTGEYNTAIGTQAIENNTVGDWNVGLGSGALNQNISGNLNTAVGTSAMWHNRTGNENAAFGEEALAGSIDGSNNTAIGTRAMFSFEFTNPGKIPVGHANNNTAVGYESLREITTGSWNIAVGMHALRVNSTGNDNVALGSQTLMHNTTANGNVALGRSALYNVTTGSYNTAIGFEADVAMNNLTNTTAIGYGAKATANNQVMIGNGDVTSIRGYAELSTISDKRLTKNVQANIPGLAFINKLQPVSYNWNKSSQTQRPISGFIAQDVETAAKSIGYDFSGIDIDESNDGIYGLQHSKLVVPLVKAVQELSEQNDTKDAEIAELQHKVEVLTGLVNKLLEDHNLTSNHKIPAIIEASLGQNYPNPSDKSTTIDYTLPQVFNSAKIVIIDASGKTRKQKQIHGKTGGNVTIDTGSLPAGAYYYSLIVDNKKIDTKKMIITK